MPLYNGLKVAKDSLIFSNAVKFMYCTGIGDKQFVGAPLTINEAGTGEYIPETFQLTENQTQELFNELWQLGFRPKDGTGNGGHIQALKDHLEDMRKLVFGADNASS